MKVRKAVIPAAGIGIRFLPATKASPKEMLLLVDKPVIQEVVEEAVGSGIDEIILITSKGKRVIEDHFDISVELENHLLTLGKEDLLKKVREISRMVEIVYVRQKEPKGLGHAVLCSRRAVGNEPFAVLLGDDLVDSSVPCLAQLIDVFEKYGKVVIALQEVPGPDVHRYGIAAGDEIQPGLFQITGLIEKPSLSEAPSNLAVIGRYVLLPEIFPVIEALEPGAGGEIQLTDALARMAEEGKVVGLVFEGTRHDAGNRIGLLKANIHYALKDKDLAGELKTYLRDLMGRWSEE